MDRNNDLSAPGPSTNWESYNRTQYGLISQPFRHLDFLNAPPSFPAPYFSSSSTTLNPNPLYLPPAAVPSPTQPDTTPPVSPEATSNSTKPKRAPAWSPLEEETLIRIYKEEVEGLRKKGKKGQTVWSIVADKLEENMRELGLKSNSRTAQRVKEKFFNLTRRYKQAKDKIRTSGAGSEDIENCPHFDVLDEFMGSRDIVDPPFLMETESELSESATSTPSPVPSTSSSISEDSGLEKKAEAGTSKKRTGDMSQDDKGKGKATKKRKRQSKGSGPDEDDPWLQIFQESQKREEKMMEAFERSENNFKDLFLTAIKEFGKMAKKD